MKRPPRTRPAARSPIVAALEILPISPLLSARHYAAIVARRRPALPRNRKPGAFAHAG